MATGEPGQNLLRNAEAIARLLGEPEAKRIRSKGSVTPELVQAIDELVTLYAVGQLDDATKNTLANLSDQEASGVDFLAYYLADLRRKEQAKATHGGVAKLNGWKGYVPSETRDGASLIVRDDADQAALTLQGYTRLGDYKGTGAESGRRGYYYSTVAGQNPYLQGAMQTVQSSGFGVDPRTGYTVSGITAGRVPNQLVDEIQRMPDGKWPLNFIRSRWPRMPTG